MINLYYFKFKTYIFATCLQIPGGEKAQSTVDLIRAAAFKDSGDIKGKGD